jgi:hypothetical protein
MKNRLNTQSRKNNWTHRNNIQASGRFNNDLDQSMRGEKRGRIRIGSEAHLELSLATGFVVLSFDVFLYADGNPFMIRVALLRPADKPSRCLLLA